MSVDLQSRLLFKDDHVLIIDKPSGIAVHAGSYKDDSLMNYLDQLRFGLGQSPQLAHRLDRETSGCLVLGRSKQSLARLGKLFTHGVVAKTYWTVVVGAPAQDYGVVDAPLSKVDKHRGWRMMVDAKHGQPSVTEWRVLGRAGRLTWIEATPKTGRTHQIRVHMASIGCPVLGDKTYGHGVADLDGDALHLHARSISLPYVYKAPPVQALAPLPPHMAQTFTSCGWPQP